MKTISDLTSQLIRPTGKESNKEKVTLLTCPIPLGKKIARHATYEVEVFNFLLDHKDTLGIQSVIKFTNLLVDGQIVLSDGRRLVIEVKLRMNWLKACQSEWQFRKFVKGTKEAKTNRVDGAIVFFEDFLGDWNKKSKKAKNLWGWEAWYLYHCESVDDRRMDLVKLYNGKLQGYPL